METINDTKTAVQAPPGATVPSPTLSAEQEARPLAFSWILPQGQMLTRTLQRAIAISRDGANVAYTSNDRLYLRPISGAQAQIISGTSGALLPTFSPDGRWLAFWAFQDRTLKKISIDGGAVVTLAPAPTLPSSASWEGDSIAFAAPNLGILAVSSSGGTPDVWVPIEPGEIADSPQILDGGNSVLFSVTRDTGQRRWDKADIVLFSRQTGTRKVLIRGGSDARYIPTGHIIYALETTLFSVPFNPARQEVTGNPVPVLENVYHGYREISFWPFGIAQFALAANGTLIYIPSNLLSNTLSRSSEIRVVVNWLNEFKQRVK
jgi:serine/threonine-protein kinase